MVIATQPSKQVRRELARWGRILKLRVAGLSVMEIAIMEDVTTAQIYALLARAKEAKGKGWI